jgi:hypothetical protein
MINHLSGVLLSHPRGAVQLSRPRGGLQQIGIDDAARAEFAGAADVLGFAKGRASATENARSGPERADMSVGRMGISKHH